MKAVRADSAVQFRRTAQCGSGRQRGCDRDGRFLTGRRVCDKRCEFLFFNALRVGATYSARYSGSKVIAFAVIQVAPRVLCPVL